MNRVVAIPQGITPSSKPWAAAGGGIVVCTDDATVHVVPVLSGSYSRVQLCGAFVPEISAPRPIPAPIICMSSIKGTVLGVVAAGHTVSGSVTAFAYASGSDFDLYLLDPISLNKIPFAQLEGDTIVSLQFQ
jgi:hypothetical protein